MLLNYIRENKGKSLLIAGIILMWVVLGVLFKEYGYYKTWELWNVPIDKKVFSDFLLIPGSAESFRNGFEPSVQNPFEPAGRIFNYPAFWRLFFYTNITLDDTIWLVVVILILYFCAVILFPQKITITGALLMLLIVFSPSSMLLYERGNVDAFVFFICAMTILATEYSAYLATLLIFIGGVVKMFPLFGISILLMEEKRKFIWLSLGCILSMIVYGGLTFESQAAAWNTTLRGDSLSYGTFVIITRLGKYLEQIMPNLFSFTQWEFLFETVAVTLILFAGALAVRESTFLTALYQRNLAAFRMGASIYLGTFLLGNNWDYRLVFLVLTIPQLSEWFYAKNTKYRVIAFAVMAAVALSCWHLMLKVDLPFVPLKSPVNRNFLFDEFFNWLLVPGFAYLLAASFPEWVNTNLKKVFGFYKREL